MRLRDDAMYTLYGRWLLCSERRCDCCDTIIMTLLPMVKDESCGCACCKRAYGLAWTEGDDRLFHVDVERLDDSHRAGPGDDLLVITRLKRPSGYTLDDLAEIDYPYKDEP